MCVCAHVGPFVSGVWKAGSNDSAAAGLMGSFSDGLQ